MASFSFQVWVPNTSRNGNKKNYQFSIKPTIINKPINTSSVHLTISRKVYIVCFELLPLELFERNSNYGPPLSFLSLIHI